MRADLSVARLYNAGNRLSDAFVPRGHRPCIRMDQRCVIDNHGNVAFPEQKIIALVRARRMKANGLLLIAVSGAWNTACQQSSLNQTRAINPPTAVPAP